MFLDEEGERKIDLMYWGFTFPNRFTFNTRSDGNPKYEISIPGREPFALAGIWNMRKNKRGDYVPTVSVKTSEPNEAMAEIHDRQPVVLEPSDYHAWFAPSDRPPLHLLRIAPAEEMNMTGGFSMHTGRMSHFIFRPQSGLALPRWVRRILRQKGRPRMRNKS